MERKIAAILIAIQEGANIPRINSILSDFSAYILSRQGLNLKEKNLNIITVVVEADTDVIGALAGKLGRLDFVKVKTAIINLQNTQL